MGFYDSKGYWRNEGDGFYDAKGNWVNPGGSFYDGKGYSRSASSASSVTNSGEGAVAATGFMLFLPVGILWMMTVFLIEWITTHFYAVFTGYSILAFIICFAIVKTRRHQGVKFALSFAGNYLCLLSFIYIALIYAVPYVTVNGGSFGSFFEFMLVLAFGAGGIAVVQFFNYFHGKAVLEFIVGIVFFVIVMILLKNAAKDLNTMESLAQIYHIKESILFKVLFGFFA